MSIVAVDFCHSKSDPLGYISIFVFFWSTQFYGSQSKTVEVKAEGF